MTCSFSTSKCFSEEFDYNNSGTLLVILALNIDDENVTICISNAGGSELVNIRIKMGSYHGVKF